MLGAPSGPATIPSATVSREAGMPNRSAAASRSTSRAAAAAARSGGAANGIERLPNVPMSNGEVSVLPITTRTVAEGTASSSATSSPSAVRVPWPASTLPVNAVTEPSAPTCTQASSGPPHRPCPGPAGGPSSATTVTRPSGSCSKKGAASLACYLLCVV
jgi:hypothetical protein